MHDNMRPFYNFPLISAGIPTLRFLSKITPPLLRFYVKNNSLPQSLNAYQINYNIFPYMSRSFSLK